MKRSGGCGHALCDFALKDKTKALEEFLPWIKHLVKVHGGQFNITLTRDGGDVTYKIIAVVDGEQFNFLCDKIGELIKKGKEKKWEEKP